METKPTIHPKSFSLKPPTKKSTSPVMKRMMAVDMFIVAIQAQKTPSSAKRIRAFEEEISPLTWYCLAI